MIFIGFNRIKVHLKFIFICQFKRQLEVIEQLSENSVMRPHDYKKTLFWNLFGMPMEKKKK